MKKNNKKLKFYNKIKNVKEKIFKYVINLNLLRLYTTDMTIVLCVIFYW
jgi:hypothetical protein